MRLVRVLLLVAGSAVSLTILFVAVSYERGQVAQSRDQQLSLDVASEAARLDEYFERSRSLIRLVAQNPAFRQFYDEPGSMEEKLLASVPSLDEANGALRYLNVLYVDSIGEACFIDQAGPEIARAVRGEIAPIDDLSPDESGASFFHPTFALEYGEVYQAAPYVSEDTGDWVISNSTLVPYADGAKRAIVHFEVTVDSFGQLADLVDNRFQIVDADGRIVVDSTHRQVIGEPLGRPDQLQFAGVFPPDGSSSGMTMIGGQRIAYQQVGAGPNNANVWYAVTSAPASIGLLEGFGALSVGILAAGVGLVGLALTSASHQRRLRLQATTDGLTGLPNRSLFRDRADQALAMARRHNRQIAVMLIDLDRFKEVNDTLGHYCGDELLRDVAQHLEIGVRDTDTVARVGGDEFAVVLSETVGSEGAIKAAERLSAEAFTHQRLIANVPLNVRASIGIALYPDHGSDIDELLHHADVAMYHAKRNQLPLCLYNVNVDPNSPDRLDIISELEAAIERGELVLHYEPKFNIEEATLVGVEALVRWNHPTRGVLEPSDFREVAKTAGLIPSLTRYVLREATGQLRQWSHEGRDLTVAVNMSHRSLIDPTFLDDVEQAIASSGIDPQRLTLEITEDSLHDNPEQAIVVLNALRKQGVTVSLDSFNTGFSSMTYLQRLPIDEVKIDQNFIRDLAINPADQDMVRSTIELGHSLSHVVTAEGVTDSGTLHQLREMGCDLAQGVLLGRPASADELTSLLDNPNISASTNHT